MDRVDDGPHVVVTVGDEVPDEQRETIRASVLVMARRSAEAARQAFESNEEIADLNRRLHAPIRDLIEAHADAAAALDTTQVMVNSLSATDLPPGPDWPPATFSSSESTGSKDFVADQVFGAPWHFQWQWHDGHPPGTSSQDRPNGRIALGLHTDQNHNWGTAHGGFGVALTSNRVQSAAGRSLRRTNHRYFVHGGSLGGDATVEGGTEMTAMESGNLLSAASHKVFRRRVSAGEREQYHDPGWNTGETLQVDWVMLPGRVYTLNVGCWVFCEAHGGLGTASIGQASIDGHVIMLTADFTD